MSEMPGDQSIVVEQEYEYSFRVLEDPSPYPLARGAELTVQEVVYGLKLGGFTLETRLLDTAAGTEHIVKMRGKHYVLAPPCQRLRSYARRLGGRKNF